MRTHRLLVVNPRSGGGEPTAEALAEEARKRHVEPHLLRPGEDPGAVARASGAAVLGVAGGDGSLAPVAAVAVETGAAFVCVPFGTRNHFARDLGLDRDDPTAGLDAFGAGRERRIDVGRVAGRLFLNNVSLGAYAGLVHRRERHRRRREALAGARALLQVARRRHRIRARVNGEAVVARVLFVGNNPYDVSLFTLGERPRLDEGLLVLWSAAGLVPRTWERRAAERFRIELPGRTVRAAIDGEPVLLETPLELESLPRALRVLVPDTDEGTATIGGAMHDNPRASEEEQEQVHEDGRQQEEESMRYPEHHDPEEQQRRAHDGEEG